MMFVPILRQGGYIALARALRARAGDVSATVHASSRAPSGFDFVFVGSIADEHRELVRLVFGDRTSECRSSHVIDLAADHLREGGRVVTVVIPPCAAPEAEACQTLSHVPGVEAWQIQF